MFGGDFSYKKCTNISYVPKPTNIDKVKEAAELINNAKNHLLYLVKGLFWSSRSRIKAFVEKSGIPAAWTILGLSALPTDHPLNVGMLECIMDLMF
jgi:acetolactate synthase-1/2/3 large subunit